MVAAFKARVNSPITKLVLIKLADNSNDDGLCFPSYQHIADQCEISRQSAINHVKILLELGVLQKENRMRNGENTSNQFVLSMSKMVELGSQRGGLGVVKEVDHPSQRGLLGSQRGGLGVVNGVDPESSLLTINESSFNLRDEKTKHSDNWKPQNIETLKAKMQMQGVPFPEQSELDKFIFEFNHHNYGKLMNEMQRLGGFITWIKRGMAFSSQPIKTNQQPNQPQKPKQSDDVWRYPYSDEIASGKYQAGDHVPC
jgi:hypothetical protein